MKKTAKYLIRAFFYIIVLPFGLGAKLFYLLFESQLIFDFCAQMFSLIPGFIGSWFRVTFYHQTLRQAAWDITIGFGSVISKMDIKIGKGVLINGFSIIGRANIGEYTVIANHVSVLSGRYQHNFTDIKRKILDDNDSFTVINVGSNVFIGESSTVMADIGDFSIIGAGSVVVKPIPEYVVAAGNPAQIIKTREKPAV
jgi:virginiamycin A acetyltransferase